jgi:hypothetical protein
MHHCMSKTDHRHAPLHVQNRSPPCTIACPKPITVPPPCTEKCAGLPGMGVNQLAGGLVATTGRTRLSGVDTQLALGIRDQPPSPTPSPETAASSNGLFRCNAAAG